MNPLPPACHALVVNPSLHAYVLIDGAAQRDIARRLARHAPRAIALFADLSTAAQSMGPWLLPANDAGAHGIDGSAPGVNWLVSEAPADKIADHLRDWMREGDRNSPHYTRLGDGRVLRAAMDVWTPAQRAAFCAPWRGWWLADRDGRALALDLPAPSPPAPGDAGRPGWSDAQHHAMRQHGLADALIQPLKGVIRLAPTLRGREARHALAAHTLALAVAQGYTDATDQSSWIAWALQRGHCSGGIAAHPVHAQGLRGAALWEALTGDADDAGPASPDGTERAAAATPAEEARDDA
ncbi:DUF4123 domain-containing protein [Stenotrophomonas sp.]|uniref:DUF4123 domain-containing protein n=1 Tax=Stenotrophomonas sp. TaxID=69392 RepID=UPI0028AB27AE|nr:DUF4123 domain-containing protein [Stenotrophomonas sp.]